MAEDTNYEDANVSQSEEIDKETMSMFASVWVKVEVTEDSTETLETGSHRKSRRKQEKSHKILFCDLCDYTTVYKNCLELHITSHTNSKPYCCQFCSYSTKYPTSLSRHMVIKHQDNNVSEQNNLPIYKCNQCDYTANFKWNLNAHQRKHQLEKQYKCPQCPYSTAYRHNFSKHSKVHTQGVVFKCDKCPFITKFEGHITRHLAKIHKEVIEKAYMCDLCDFSTKIRWRLNIHKQRSKQETMLKCALCDFETIYMCESKKHKVTHYSKIYGSATTPQEEISPSLSNQNEELHSNLPQEELSPSTPQTCDLKTVESTEESNETSNNKYTLDSDCVDWNSIQVLESDDKDRPFLCHMCKYTSKFKAAVQRHFQRHHTGSKNRPYKCCNCDFSTKTKDQIALHNKRSKSDQVLVCKACEFTTKFKCQFVMHQKCHYAFKCTICSYSCRQKYELQKHYTNMHLGNGLKCSYCDYKAARKESLLCHETIHTGIKPFKCSLCSYMSVRKSLLDNHMKRYHSTLTKAVTIVSDSKIESLKMTIPLLEGCSNISDSLSFLQYGNKD